LGYFFHCFGFPGRAGRGFVPQPHEIHEQLLAAASTGASRDERWGWGHGQATAAPASRHEQPQ